MDHFTSLTPCERDETQTRSLTRRAFLGNFAAGTIALGTVGATLALSAAAHEPKADVLPRPNSSKVTPPMTGAEYVALIDRSVMPKRALQMAGDCNDARELWAEIAKEPLIEAIDVGALVVCPDCLFVNLRFAACHSCARWRETASEDVAWYLHDLHESGESPREAVEEDLTRLWIERVADLFDEPEASSCCGEILCVVDLLRAETTV